MTARSVTTSQSGADHRRALCLLLQGLVEGLAFGWVALDVRGCVVLISDSLRAWGEDSSEPLPRAIRLRLHRDSAALLPGETRVFPFHWERARGDAREYRVVAAAVDGIGARGGRLTVLALQEKPNELAAEHRPSLSGGGGRLEREPICWEALLGECLAEVRASCGSREHDVDLRIDPVLPPCLGDRALLQRMLREACLAALASTPEAGTLSLRLRTAGFADGATAVRHLVRDCGRGLDAAAIERVLRRDERADLFPVERRLRAARAIAERHGGRMHVVSAPGRGTSVVIDLPACESARREGGAAHPQPPRRGLRREAA